MYPTLCCPLRVQGKRQGCAIPHTLPPSTLFIPHFHSHLQILDRWLWEGVLDDPHSEFMVQEVKVRAGGGGGRQQGQGGEWWDVGFV